MKKSLGVLVVVLFVSISSLGQTPFSGISDFDGTMVLWFAGTCVTTQLHGELSLSGVLPLKGEAVSFVTNGKITGSGEGDTNTLEGIAWTTFTCHGALGNDEDVEIRGGLTITSGDFLLSADATGEGTGSFYLVVLLSDTRIEVTGSVHGSSVGSFVPPDDPSTMQLVMSGTMDLEATSSISCSRSDPVEVETLQERLPWDLETWPGELSSQLLHLLVDSRPEE